MPPLAIARELAAAGTASGLGHRTSGRHRGCRVRCVRGRGSPPGHPLRPRARRDLRDRGMGGPPRRAARRPADLVLVDALMFGALEAARASGRRTRCSSTSTTPTSRALRGRSARAAARGCARRRSEAAVRATSLPELDPVRPDGAAGRPSSREPPRLRSRRCSSASAPSATRGWPSAAAVLDAAPTSRRVVVTPGPTRPALRPRGCRGAPGVPPELMPSGVSSATVATAGHDPCARRPRRRAAAGPAVRPPVVGPAWSARGRAARGRRGCRGRGRRGAARRRPAPRARPAGRGALPGPAAPTPSRRALPERRAVRREGQGDRQFSVRPSM